MSKNKKNLKVTEFATSYPKPLSASREKEILDGIKAGDPTAKEQLINYNLRLVAHIAKKYMQYDEVDDLIAIGDYGLIKAAQTFNPDKNIKFSTYASRCIENEILMHLRKLKKIKEREISLDSTIGNEEKDKDLTILDTLYVVDENHVFENVFKSVRRDKIIKILKDTLKPLEYKIIMYRFGFKDGIIYSQKEIGDMLNFSRSYVSRMELSALKKLKEYLQNRQEDWNC